MLRSRTLGLVPNGKRTVTPVPAELLALVPQPSGKNETVKSSGADPIRDTVPMIQRLAKRQLWQGKKLAKALKGRTVEETVKNDWDFIFKHIQYQEDPEDKETVRSLRRLIHEGKGDCDCFVNALQNLLINQGITNAKLRVAAYGKGLGVPGWQHIYIVVPKKDGGHITLDPVVHKFDYEVPYSKKKDFDMKLQSLDGLGCTGQGQFGGLGCGCQSSSASTPAATSTAPGAAPALNSAKKTNAIDELVPLKWIKREGLVATEEYLTQSQIPYTKTTGADKKVSLTVDTPDGPATLNTIITKQEQADFTALLTKGANKVKTVATAVAKDHSGLLWGAGLTLVGYGIYKILSPSKKEKSLSGIIASRDSGKSLKSLQL